MDMHMEVAWVMDILTAVVLDMVTPMEAALDMDTPTEAGSAMAIATEAG